jgi:hypothetical protein
MPGLCLSVHIESEEGFPLIFAVSEEPPNI